jgi:hypothetical protein
MSGSDDSRKPAAATLREVEVMGKLPPFNFSRAPLAQQQMLLPIYLRHKRQILYAMENHGLMVLS